MNKIIFVSIASITFFFAEAQNVGVGNTSPLMRLHVSSLSDTALLLIDNNTALASGTSTGMYFKNGSWYTGAVKTIGTGTNVARIGLYTYASGSTSGLQERLSITDDGIVGIGNSNPLLGGLVADTKVGAINAMFGSNTTGVAIETNYPGIAFNTYYNAGRKFIANGYGSLIGLNPANGDVAIYNTGASGVAGAAAGTIERLRVAANGDVVIGTGSSFGRLTINGDNATSGNAVEIYTNTGTNTALRTENFNGDPNSVAILAYCQNGTGISVSANGNKPALAATGISQFYGAVNINTGSSLGNLTVGSTNSIKPLHVYTSTAGEAMRVENFTGGTGSTALLAYSQNGTAVAASSMGFASALTVAGGSGWAIETAGNSLFTGNVTVIGTLSKSAGTFKIDHPLDPANKYLIHSFVESPDMLNVYNGIVTTNKDVYATAELPSYFEAENIDFKYQLTVMGKNFAQAIVYDEVKQNQFVIKTNEPGVKVSWQVTGVRNDAYAKKYRIKDEEEKTGNAKGKYLSPELFGKQ